MSPGEALGRSMSLATLLFSDLENEFPRTDMSLVSLDANIPWLEMAQRSIFFCPDMAIFKPSDSVLWLIGQFHRPQYGLGERYVSFAGGICQLWGNKSWNFWVSAVKVNWG